MHTRMMLVELRVAGKNDCAWLHPWLPGDIPLPVGFRAYLVAKDRWQRLETNLHRANEFSVLSDFFSTLLYGCSCHKKNLHTILPLHKCRQQREIPCHLD